MPALRSLTALALALGLLAACSCSSTPATTVVPTNVEVTQVRLDPSHAAWTAVLAAHVRDDGFDYASLAADPAPLARYLVQLQSTSESTLAAMTRAERYAFWINVYNAYTIAKVVDHYPLKSIKDLGGLPFLSSVFDSEFIPLQHLVPDRTDPLALNDIEHGILRAEFQDARVHAAINCASRSCPPLRNEAFVAEHIDAQLDEQTRGFVADRTRNRFDVPARRLELSKIFDWFDEDFERDAGSVRGYVMRYSPEAEKMFLQNAKIGFAAYDWSLNEAR